MSSKYVNTLIKIVQHVSGTKISSINSQSCSLVNDSAKNLTCLTCSDILCDKCAFNIQNHKKIDYLITKGNSDG